MLLKQLKQLWKRFKKKKGALEKLRKRKKEKLRKKLSDFSFWRRDWRTLYPKHQSLNLQSW